MAADPAGEAWRLVMLLARKRRFPEVAAEFGLNPGAVNALLYLEAGAPKPMGALADAWKCDASNVTWLIDRLEEHGLAERVPHATDRRVRTVALTRKGQRVRTQIEARLFDPPDELRTLTTSDLHALVRILGKIAPA